MAAMMASLAVGQNIAGSMNNMMSGINQPVQAGITSPPIPTVSYHIVVNGQATGPLDFNALQQMVIRGQLSESSLVWRLGMSEWIRADSTEEHKSLFNTAVPPIPQENG